MSAKVKNASAHGTFRVALVDRAVLQRGRAEELLREQAGFEVVHSGPTIAGLVAWGRREGFARQPHLLVLSIAPGRLPQRMAEDVRALRRKGTRVMAFVSSLPNAMRNRLAELGVDGVVTVHASEREFVTTAREILCRPGNGKLAFTAQTIVATRRKDDAARLSAQEERVLILYASGLTISEVSERMEVRPDTARKYLSRLRAKFEATGDSAHTKAGLTAIARREGYLAAGD